MKVVSYYLIKNGDERKEFLVDHVKEMINLLNNFKNSRAQKFGELLCRRLHLSSADFESYLLQTIVLHDIGKAFYRQNLPKHISEGHLSFPGHEVVSAVITWYALERLSLSSMKPVIFAVLYHHHAMDVERRLQGSIQRLRNPSDAVEDLKEDLEELKSFIPRTLMDKLLEVLKEIGKETSWTFMRDVSRKFKIEIKRKLWDVLARSNDAKSFVQKKLSLLTLSCLISLDYIAASRLRGRNVNTAFGKVVRDFYKIYCQSPPASYVMNKPL